MKLYDMLMFLFIFNLFMWVMSAGIGLFPMESYGMDPELIPAEDALNPIGDVGSVILAFAAFFGPFGSGYVNVIALGAALGTLAMIGWLSAGQAPAGIVYGLLAYFFFTAFIKTTALFIGLAAAFPGAGFVLLIYFI